MNNELNTDQHNKPLDIPVLLMVFNRLDSASQVFNAIKKVQPAKLYIACDGPRAHKENEKEKVNAVREYLTSQVDWPCEVKTLFRENNLGCKRAVSGAIDWFFSQEEMGVILEDDCLPSQSFFWFCRELLLHYKDDTRIWQISGFNMLDGKHRKNEHYFFSHFGFSWGWASWRRAWAHFDVDMKLWPQAKQEDIINTYPLMPSRYGTWEETYSGKIDTWDYQWYFAMASNSALSIVSTRSLIKNIGFGPDATHTFNDISGRGKIENHDISFPLTHPNFVIYNLEYETALLKQVNSEYSLFNRIKNRIRRLIGKV
jgi:hypothetical protein